MTKVVNLYAGPGTGKSTYGAYMYYLAKAAGVNAELVREYVKDWAWEGRHIGEFDQFYFMGKQMRRESLLYGKVDFIVTDSPNLLPIMYAREHSPTAVAEGVAEGVSQFYRHCKDSEVAQHYHVFLERSKKYNPAGRYQTEDEARALDDVVRNLLDEFVGDYMVLPTTEGAMREYLMEIEVLPYE